MNNTETKEPANPDAFMRSIQEVVTIMQRDNKMQICRYFYDMAGKVPAYCFTNERLKASEIELSPSLVSQMIRFGLIRVLVEKNNMTYYVLSEYGSNFRLYA